MVRAPDTCSKGRGNFFSPQSTFFADSYFGIRSTSVLPQLHVKDPGHPAKGAGGRLRIAKHDMHPTFVALHEVTL